MNNTKEKILEVMFDLIAEKGYEKTSTSQICEKVGITKPTLYYYFKSKESLFLETIIIFGEKYVKEIKIPKKIDKLEDFKNGFYTLGNSILNTYLRDEKYRKFMVEVYTLKMRIPSVKEAFSAFDEMYVNSFYNIVKKGQEIGAFDRNIDSSVLTNMIIIFIDGLEFSIENELNTHFFEVWKSFANMLFISGEHS